MGAGRGGGGCGEDDEGVEEKALVRVGGRDEVAFVRICVMFCFCDVLLKHVFYCFFHFFYFFGRKTERGEGTKQGKAKEAGWSRTSRKLVLRFAVFFFLLLRVLSLFRIFGSGFFFFRLVFLFFPFFALFKVQ